jgi:hypothetical protein
MAAYGAIAVHGNYFLLGMVAAPVNRYSLAMWPTLAMSLVCFVGYCLGTQRLDKHKPR